MRTGVFPLLPAAGLLGLVLMMPGCGGNGAIPAGDRVFSEMERFRKAAGVFLDYRGRAELILHRAGSYQEYPKNLNCPEFSAKEKVRDICDLMDLSFGRYGADGIEIDLQTVPGSGDFSRVYISHDRIDPGKALGNEAVKRYLQRNSLDLIIAHYVRKGYHRRGKSLYLELKVPRKSLFENNGPLDEAEKTYVKKILSDLEGAVAAADKSTLVRSAVKSRIGLISFNLHALQYAYEVMREPAYGLHFLAATNRPFAGRLAALFDRELNYLNDGLKQSLEKAYWLNGIWYDPRGVEDSFMIFNKVNAGRKIPLGLYLFTYKLAFDDLVGVLRGNLYKDDGGTVRKLGQVRGLCFEVQAFDRPDRHASCQ